MSCKTLTLYESMGWVFASPILLQVLLTHRSLPARGAHSLFLLSQVEEVIHPRFLAQLLSPEAQLDVLALAEDLLEHEKRLTPVQVSHGRKGPQVS